MLGAEGRHRASGSIRRPLRDRKTDTRVNGDRKRIGKAFVYTVIDDDPRVTYAEIHNDETAAAAIGVLRRAVSWPEARGITGECVSPDNGYAYKTHAWREA